MARNSKVIRADADNRPMTEEEARLAEEARAYAASDADYQQYEETAETEDLGPAPTVGEAIALLEASGDAERAAQAAEYHKTARRYLGVAAPLIEDQVRLWRAQATAEERLALARGLWDSDIHEAKIAAAKLMTQARIRPDDAAWDLIRGWVGDLDTWAIADAVSAAAARRVTADLARLDGIAGWLASDNLWTRRTTLTATLPLTRARHPDAQESAARDRILDWCATLAPDRNWFIQKAIADWLSALAKRDPESVRRWLVEYGEDLKSFARKDVTRKL
ncbi:DNA alkylation repair protein [Paenirhodobacter populi]|nr:DNA alkylation repair protein [Sinirhodobacter populi]